MNLFALTDVPGARIVRFPLTQDLQEEIRNLFSDQYTAFNYGIAEIIPFDGRYRPDDGELLTINEFDDIDGIANAVANPLFLDLFDPQIHSLDSIKALFTGHSLDGLERVLIQLFEIRRLIANKGLALFFSENTFRKMNDAGLTLDTRLLAVLEGRTLMFQSFHFLRRVFDLSEHFNEATSDEMTAFATHEKLSVENVATFSAGGSTLIRKKIALILQSGVLDNFTTEQIVTVAQNFNVQVQLSENGRIVVPTNVSGN